MAQTKEVTKTNGVVEHYTPPELDSFMADKLGSSPDPENILVNKFANNSKYIPIAVVETELDNLYKGLWKADNFRWQVVANEIVGSLDLHVLHPIAGIWITRPGAAAVMIQTKKDATPTVENKITNTLVKDFPHLKASCLQNAAKSLGKVFGRDLNRKQDDRYDIDAMTNLTTQSDLDMIAKEFQECDSVECLTEIWDGLTPEQKEQRVILHAFGKKKKQLKDAAAKS